jgi:hypothetical protein
MVVDRHDSTLTPPRAASRKARARGGRSWAVRSRLQAMTAGGAVTPEQIQGLAERKAAPAPVLPDPCLQSEPLSLGIALQPLCAVMAQLLKCL